MVYGKFANMATAGALMAVFFKNHAPFLNSDFLHNLSRTRLEEINESFFSVLRYHERVVVSTDLTSLTTAISTVIIAAMLVLLAYMKL